MTLIGIAAIIAAVGYAVTNLSYVANTILDIQKRIKGGW